MVRPHSAPAPEGYARYVLGVLVVVYVFNFLDRQIIAILAELRCQSGAAALRLEAMRGRDHRRMRQLVGSGLQGLQEVRSRAVQN
ncbi:MAG TPA: hypothetical protein VKD72_14940 [Gemmataceae bacterium]|nr:hypothetical protein [Gemmataceae bacterium]